MHHYVEVHVCSKYNAVTTGLTKHTRPELKQLCKHTMSLLASYRPAVHAASLSHCRIWLTPAAFLGNQSSP